MYENTGPQLNCMYRGALLKPGYTLGPSVTGWLCVDHHFGITGANGTDW